MEPQEETKRHAGGRSEERRTSAPASTDERFDDPRPDRPQGGTERTSEPSSPQVLHYEEPEQPRSERHRRRATQEADIKRYGAVDKTFKAIRGDEKFDEQLKIMQKINTRRKDAEDGKDLAALDDVERFLKENKLIHRWFKAWEQQAMKDNRPFNDPAVVPPSKAWMTAEAMRQPKGPKVARDGQAEGNQSVKKTSRQARRRWTESAQEDFARRLAAAGWTDETSIKVAKKCLDLKQVQLITEIIKCGDLDNKAWRMIRRPEVHQKLVRTIVKDLGHESNQQTFRKWITVPKRSELQLAVKKELPLLKLDPKYTKNAKSVEKALER